MCYAVSNAQDEGQTRTSVLLGTWNREKHIEWVNANQEKKTNKNKKGQQYISMYYTGGDMCELTNQPRVVEVKLKCVTRKDNSQLVTMYLIEPQTCSYILGVENPLFCNLIDNTDEYGIPDQEKLFAHSEGQ
ncbi:unnamed protein product [Adineta steineri]|uniref:Endoplasmic reticulum lectin 1 n=1 Tax=Adineta steineri TaxID=433720 RepID=A0A815CH67_9BILA|nr:unnamed protein product [Adineta steineri]